MPILQIDKYFITRSNSPNVPMVCDVLEQKWLSFILKFRLALKLCVYLFDDGILVHDISSLELSYAEY